MPLYAKELIAGGVTGGIAKTTVAPFERVKILFQTRTAEFKTSGLLGSFVKIAKSEGVLAPSLYGIFPYAGLKFYFYEEMKRHVPEEYKKDITVKLVCGSVAGLLGQTFTYPLDVVRRQMQVQQVSNGSNMKGTLETIVTTIALEQGWKQLFSGLSLNYLKIVPSVAIGFTVYDTMKSALQVPSRDESVVALVTNHRNGQPSSLRS
ncbi:hypothetical protein Nepgr_005234 [Nepenthes gracilis]|uniref:Mitochondrial carrier protein n=1 Tax=Nepenthes gracilis TaxID=150966 RepID=A0AAD3S2V6_NEPGR|nr:hypothetical protein Nepgr_005234 [Nepenthes gracilis]